MFSKFESTAMTLIVDVQGFKTDENQFIFKEIAFTSATDNSVESYLLQPPFRWSQLPARYRSTNAWLIRNFHGLPWDSGSVRYDFLYGRIERKLNKANTVYLKGSEKRTWLLNTFPHIQCIIDLDDLECPALNQLQKNNQDIESCCYHNIIKGSIANCAVRNVKLLKYWFYNKKMNMYFLQ